MRRRDSLARGAPPARPGTLHLRALADGITTGPEPGRVVRFGRGREPGIDLSVGEGDLRISRRHGEVAYRQGHWWLRNTGLRPLRLPAGRWIRPSADPVPLATGYTPVFLAGSRYREHLVEVYVTGPSSSSPSPVDLADDERLLLVVLGQHYLRHEAHPRPLSHPQAAEQLHYLQPYARWSEPVIAHRIEDIRRRLDHGDVDDLLRVLVESATLVPPDLALLDDNVDEDRDDRDR